MKQKLALIVPYRNRQAHLDVFIPAIRKQLVSEEIDFDIFVVEQLGDAPFNRGKIKNSGFVMAQDYAWVCFHDVDLLPISNSDYSIPCVPTRLCNSTSKSNYEEFDNNNLGGVVLFLPNHFIQANGYNNDYWGWGFEDNDLTNRCVNQGLEIELRPTAYDHLTEQIASGPDEHFSANESNFFKHDYANNGLNTLEFRTAYREQKKTYLHVYIDIGAPENS
jgi:beta-1,4-galactosyltransferase 3